MGSGQEQAELWGPGARDWADYNEPMCTPFYEAVLDATGRGQRHQAPRRRLRRRLRPAARGPAGRHRIRPRRGRAPMLDIARERVPGASLTIGDLEDPLPYPEGAFDVVTSFNSVQYAATPSRPSST